MEPALQRPVEPHRASRAGGPGVSRVRAVGRRIRAARRRAGLSLADVGELAAKLAGVDIDLDGLRAIEQGRAELPDSKVLQALGRALDIDPDELSAGNRYINETSQALLEVVEALSVLPLDPKSVTALAEKLGESRDQVYRALVNLDAAGWAEQTPGGGWRLAPHVSQLSRRLGLALDDAYRRHLT
ncbi:MAG: helix-turn-helix domain-containing protein [Holophagales bacterium]|nr:helix-turn-helix domain-containing protein [Holophagales bacterium]MYG30108.1 helix-turn-helix domain-containing protein [Holophagales bacterium]MYI78796.1 helix-turn-helix domain-containing protein [Holophagales bacterium]